MPRLPFNSIRELDLPLTEMVGGRIDFIHDLFLTFPYQVRHSLPDSDQDLVVLVSKKNRAKSMRQIAEYPGRVVLVFVPGDASVRGAYMPERRGLPPNVVAAFATNNELPDQRAISVPLGVRINKLRPLQFVRQNHKGPRDRLLYGNFALNQDHYRPDKADAAHIRARLVDRLRDLPWVSLDISGHHRDDAGDLLRFYSEISGHKFVLSPEGNGIDCYRTWEILYLGSIPIVMVSTAMSAFSDLPILFTDDYSEISEEYLEQRWSEMSSRSFEIQRMLRSWYLHRFLEAVSALERPRFVCWQVEDSPPGKFIDGLRRSSHSLGGLVAETPTPPFTGRLRMADPACWHVVGGLELEEASEGLRVSACEEGRRVLELPLETIAGGSFSLVGRVKQAVSRPLDLEIGVRDRSEPIISVALDPDVETLRLDFIARSDRTVLTLTAADDAPLGSLVLSELAVHANL